MMIVVETMMMTLVMTPQPAMILLQAMIPQPVMMTTTVEREEREEREERAERAEREERAERVPLMMTASVNVTKVNVSVHTAPN